MSITVNEGGKEAIIYLAETDNDTISQVKRMLPTAPVEHARIMPDCHPGAGCCIGFTSRLTTHSIPSYIGGDIGCGIAVYPLDITVDKIRKKPESFCRKIEAVIPVGATAHDLPVISVESLFPRAQAIAEDFKKTYMDHFHVELQTPKYDEMWFAELLKRIGANRKTVMCQLGTLGGGNHFIEVGNDEDNKVYISVHSGSRGLGQYICKYHQSIITKGSKPDWNGYEDALKSIPKRDRTAAERELRMKYLSPKPKGLTLTGEEAYLYYFDMIFAQCYAELNRQVMLSRATYVLGSDMDLALIIQSTHNYIDFGDMIWRKGAVKAAEGQSIVIALNMKEGLLLARGKGNPEWNYSAPHGAGRLVPRGRASQHSTVKEFRDSMKDIYTNHSGAETLDECPAMYKNSSLIIECSLDTCSVYQRIVPLINIKGGGTHG
jgi:RNA-splicing ligase RtcB